MQNMKVERIGDNKPPVMYGLAKGFKNGAHENVGVCLKMDNPQTASTVQELGMGHVTRIPLACGASCWPSALLPAPACWQQKPDM